MLRQTIGVLALGALISGVAGGRGRGQDGSGGAGDGHSGQFPVLFCTQVPNPYDFTTIGSTFGNHMATANACPRGGDLWIRYPDGTLKNLTQAAGYGQQGFQGANAIAVREPCVHWSGTKALFSMIHGAPGFSQPDRYFWQIYEIRGLGPTDMPVIRHVAGQFTRFNNVSPAYTSDDKILFTSDRPRGGEAHLYPQLDEYEEAPTITGIWKLDPDIGTTEILNHTPSGAFSPFVDSFGRVVFSRWDHLVRDQQADDDNICECDQFGTFNYTSEQASAGSTGDNDEVFPEPRGQWIGYVNDHMPGYSGDLNGWAPHLVGSEINHFFPWAMNQDGTDEETLNHIGRHELHNYIVHSLDNDPNLSEQIGISDFASNQNSIGNLTYLREDPLHPGTYFAINAPEFFTHGSGQVVRLHGSPGMTPDEMSLDYITHPDTANFDTSPSSQHSGMYRNVLPLSDGTWIACHAPTTQEAENQGSTFNPDPTYDFRLRTLVQAGSYWAAGPALTNGIVKSVQWYQPGSGFDDVPISYNGPLWELWPAEVAAHSRPPMPTTPLAGPEQQVLNAEDVEVSDLQTFLRTNGLALIVSRNVTKRDHSDLQQPFNLRVAGASTETIAMSGTVYDIAHLQIFQGDQIRGLTMGGDSPIPGRRVLAQPLHDGAATNPPNPSGPAGSVRIAPDGSTAALVPAKRALSWQLTNAQGEGIVRERYWVTFQPGEIRTCTSCHGGGTADQQGNPAPANPPQALAQLLQYLKSSGSL